MRKVKIVLPPSETPTVLIGELVSDTMVAVYFKDTKEYWESVEEKEK